MDKIFDFQRVESELNNRWVSNNVFKATVNKNKKPFSIIMPPPNITSRLHIGHAFSDTIIDCIGRFKRMQGFEVLILPGADHAAIATEVKVVEELKKQGIEKKDLTKEEFMNHIEFWYKKYTKEICDQIKRLGISCDWTRFAFTMDDHSKDQVNKAFNKLHKDGYIYQGERMINWCATCNTALSDAEVEYSEVKRPIWTIKYGPISVATTRPETMFGDVAVAVNPKDTRYKNLIGTMVDLPLTGRQILVIADDSVDMKFGTGAVKITPAHDNADNAMGEKHKLPAIRVINEKGFLFGEYAGKYADLSVLDARAKVIEDLDKLGLIQSKKEIVSNIGECYRCHNTVEPSISKQWFVRMKDLAQPAIDVLNNGLKLVPKKYEKIYMHWLNNIKDWCISRQLFSGHQIPIEGETDVLDTWFSSALWPFSTLNKNKEDFEYFYPSNVMVTAYEIIFFWVIRMVFSGIYHTDKVPFENVLFHGLVRDGQGRKMSKSLGNGIDPVNIIDKYGTDVLRYSLISGSRLDHDPRYDEDKAVKARNFTNKIWNATKFVLAHKDNKMLVDVLEAFLKLINPVMPFITQEIWQVLGHTTELAFEEFPQPVKGNKHWIITSLNKIIKGTTQKYEKYEYGIAANELQQFFWTDFCDKFIEECKPVQKPKVEKVVVEDPSIKINFYKSEIERAEKMLSNAGFVKNAPKELVESEKEKVAKYKALLYTLIGE